MSDDRLAEIKQRREDHGWSFAGWADSEWLIAEVEALRSRCEAAEAQNELLEEDVLRFLRQRNAALERAAADIHPGPDGADDIIRREMVREWVDEGHDRVDEEDRQRLTAIQRMIAAEARCEAAEAATEAVQKRRIEMREQVAAWMIEQGFATGHGDSVKSLLGQLTWQIEALRVRAGIADELAAALEGVRAINTAYRTGSQPSGKALDAANKAADALARWAASGVSEQAETGPQ